MTHFPILTDTFPDRQIYFPANQFREIMLKPLLYSPYYVYPLTILSDIAVFPCISPVIREIEVRLVHSGLRSQPATS